MLTEKEIFEIGFRKAGSTTEKREGTNFYSIKFDAVHPNPDFTLYYLGEGNWSIQNEKGKICYEGKIENVLYLKQLIYVDLY